MLQHAAQTHQASIDMHRAGVAMQLVVVPMNTNPKNVGENWESTAGSGRKRAKKHKETGFLYLEIEVVCVEFGCYIEVELECEELMGEMGTGGCLVSYFYGFHTYLATLRGFRCGLLGDVIDGMVCDADDEDCIYSGRKFKIRLVDSLSGAYVFRLVVEMARAVCILENPRSTYNAYSDALLLLRMFHKAKGEIHMLKGKVPKAFIDHYEVFLGQPGITQDLNIDDLFGTKLDENDALNMIRNVSSSDIERGIFSMGNDNSLGPEILPFEEGSLPVKYLGVPLITYRLVGSIGLFSMHVYWSSMFILPTRVLLDIEQLMHGFLWKGISKVAWEVVCLPKVEGGLGIKRLGVFNNALMSFVASRLVMGHVHPIWFDNWCSLSPLASFISSRDIYQAGLTSNSKVSDLLLEGTLVWPPDLIARYPALLSVTSPSLVGPRDQQEWRNRSGNIVPFSVNEV
ncbi:hypothetical protein Tco_0004289 [Tanacetum coccineum]